MKVGILNPFRGSMKPMIGVYKQILDFNKIPYIDLDIDDPEFWTKVKTLDLFLAKIAHTDDDIHLASEIIPIINNVLKIPCFPNYSTVWHYDDKIKQSYLLSQFGFPVAKSFIFWDKINALKWANQAEYPVVFKLKGGSGSANVLLIKSSKKAKNIIRKSFGRGIHPHYFDKRGKLKAFNYDIKKNLKYYIKPIYRKYIQKVNAYPNYHRHKNYVYFQEFLPNNEYDTRVAIVGKRAWAFKRFVRPNDFRASGSNNYDARRDKIDMRNVKIAFDISKKLGFQSMAYDFVYDQNNNPIIVEISYTYGDYPEFSNGYWDENLNWIDGKYIPEYLELVDALGLPDLKQPDIELASPYTNAKMLI
jgi:glutathione synthase/RimK-type ligase-like ATP-grasp enzyme